MNNWSVRYHSIAFFERALRSHSKVLSFSRCDDICFHIELINGKYVVALLVDEYVLGLAAVHRAQEEFSDVRYVVTCGNWNGYTSEAKEYGLENGIGIFNSSEFFGAIHRSNPIEYVRLDEDGNPEYAYKTT